MKRETCNLEKKQENCENIFFKPLANNRLRLTLKIMDDLLLTVLHEKVMICHLK